METSKVKIVRGNYVRFYDCQTAMIDKDYSGENPKHYPIGKVVSIYDKRSYFGGNMDELCDIQIGERVSRGHFLSGVTLVSRDFKAMQLKEISPSEDIEIYTQVIHNTTLEIGTYIGECLGNGKCQIVYSDSKIPYPQPKKNIRKIISK